MASTTSQCSSIAALISISTERTRWSANVSRAPATTFVLDSVDVDLEYWAPGSPRPHEIVERRDAALREARPPGWLLWSSGAPKRGTSAGDETRLRCTEKPSDSDRAVQ